MTEQVDTIVIGAGAVGLAIAREFSRNGHEVIILESADAIGTGISARSSEVIHAGIYYQSGSLKAELCVAGKVALYKYCESRNIPHRRTGKLIVATTPEEAPQLEPLLQQAHANGVTDVSYVDGSRIADMEPALRAEKALLSPTTGIIDSHSLMHSFLGEAEDHGARVALRSKFRKAEAGPNGISVEIEIEGGEHIKLACRHLINAAGHGAHEVAGGIDGLSPDFIPERYLAKGTYFLLKGPSPFRRLIYPVPNSAGLGIHLTIDLGGQARFGPDVEWIEREDYETNAGRAHQFRESIREYYPGLGDDALLPGYAGIRPKIIAPGQPPGDFVIQGPDAHGLDGLVNLFGIESPGLTSALAIAAKVYSRLRAE
jgi:L-2-hydroxyglutarate oxidase LhgO